MTVLNLRPVGWDGMTPKQWGAVRAMVREVLNVATRNLDIDLMTRAIFFLINTAGRDV